MFIELNKDVLAVAEFIQNHCSEDIRVDVAKALVLIAPALWGKGNQIDILSLSEPAPMAD